MPEHERDHSGVDTGRYDSSRWVETNPVSGVLEQGLERLWAGQTRTLLVDPMA